MSNTISAIALMCIAVLCGSYFSHQLNRQAVIDNCPASMSERDCLKQHAVAAEQKAAAQKAEMQKLNSQTPQEPMPLEDKLYSFLLITLAIPVVAFLFYRLFNPETR